MLLDFVLTTGRQEGLQESFSALNVCWLLELGLYSDPSKIVQLLHLHISFAQQSDVIVCCFAAINVVCPSAQCGTFHAISWDTPLKPLSIGQPDKSWHQFHSVQVWAVKPTSAGQSKCLCPFLGFRTVPPREESCRSKHPIPYFQCKSGYHIT